MLRLEKGREMAANHPERPVIAGLSRSTVEFNRPAGDPPALASPVMLLSVPPESTALPHASNRLYWLCQFIGWGLYAVGNLVGAVVVLHAPAERAALDLLILSALGLGSSHALRAYMRAHGWARLRRTTLFGRILLASSVCGVAIAAVKTLFGLAPWQTGDFPIEFGSVQRFLALVVPALNWTVLMLLWCALYFGALALRAHKSAQLRESELARALQLSELRGLKSQLNPHYLFNALNTVRALIAIDPSAAQRAVTQLARTLRYTLGAGQDDLVTLEQELATVEDYLAIESLRLGERLRVRWDMPAAARGVRIPVMLLQTLVENAIKHGIAELPSGGLLKVAASLDTDVFTLTVENACPNPAMNPSSDGIGLRNASERLRHLFGRDASLQLDITPPPSYPSEPAQAIARVTIRLSP
jgi:two-component system sensor histidine kinase AlgZ